MLRFISWFALLPWTGLAVDKFPLPELTPELKQELVQHLQTHWTSPEQYVVSKFIDHDIA